MLGCPAPRASVPELPDGAGDPVQTAGVVPGIDDACWGDEHALTSATLVADARQCGHGDGDIAVTGELRHSESLTWPTTRSQPVTNDDDAGRLAAECGDSRFDGCAQLFAHRVRGGVLAVSIGEVHRRDRHVG